MRRVLATLIIVFTVLIAGPVLAEKTDILVGRDYFEATDLAIREAKESICVAMYIFIVTPEPTVNPASILLEDLISAKKRGVSVKVILDDSKFGINYNAYKRLQQAGVDVYLDSSRAVLHGKGIVIDSRIFIIGSFNWTRAALYNNHEFAVYTEGAQQAKKLLDYISTIELSPQPPIPPQEPQGPRLPDSLLISSEGPRLSELFTNHSEKAFDLYLYLVKKAQMQNSNTLKIDYREFGTALGYTKNYYLNVFQPLSKLVRKYGLIRHKPWSKYLELAAVPTAEYIIIPEAYWDYGFHKKLIFPEKYMFLVCLSEAQKSNRNPYWFRSNRDLSRMYNISESSITKGVSGLESENILDVERHKPDEPGNFEERLANDYHLNPLQSQEQFQKLLMTLSEKYGSQATTQACELSAQLDEPKDLEKIETYIGLIRTYGYEKVREVNFEVAAKSRETGFRDISQVILLLKQDQHAA